MTILDITPGHDTHEHGDSIQRIDGWDVHFTTRVAPDVERVHFCPTRDQAERWAKWFGDRQERGAL